MLHDQDQVRAEPTEYLSSRSDTTKEGQPRRPHDELPGKGRDGMTPSQLEASDRKAGATGKTALCFKVQETANHTKGEEGMVGPKSQEIHGKYQKEDQGWAQDLLEGPPAKAQGQRGSHHVGRPRQVGRPRGKPKWPSFGRSVR